MEGISPVRIMVVGVGGGGSNAVDRMISVEITQVEYLVMNTDAQALTRSEAPNKLVIGGQRSRGLGAGGDPHNGEEAAKQSQEQIAKALENADLVFIAAGMGGGTGSGAAPIVADVARSQGALTIAVVTKPFSFEGFRRSKVAEEAINNLRQHCDAMIVVPNDKLLSFISDKVTLDVAFRIADDVLRQGIQGISELITKPGLINVDFADVRRILTQGGNSLMSIAEAKGPERATEAAQSAIQNPLVDADSITGATGILVNIVGGPDMTLHEASRAVEIITEQANPEAEIIFGAAIDNAMGDKVQVTLVATGVNSESSRVRKPDMIPLPVRDTSRERVPLTQPQVAQPAASGNGRKPMDTARKETTSSFPTNLRTNDLEVPAFLRRLRSAL